MRSRAQTLMHILLIGWIILVYGVHYWVYYGPRVTRFLQQWRR